MTQLREITLECPREILKEISEAGWAARGALRMGVLFGGYEEGVVQVREWLPTAPPAYHLVPRTDQDCLVSLMGASAPNEPAGLFVYRYQRDSDPGLTDFETELFDRLFPQYWQVALTVREEKNGCAIRFFGRGLAREAGA